MPTALALLRYYRTLTMPVGFWERCVVVVVVGTMRGKKRCNIFWGGDSAAVLAATQEISFHLMVLVLVVVRVPK